MSPRKNARRTGEDLAARADHLSRAAEAVRPVAAAGDLAAADAVLEKVGQRAGISPETTVVAFFGATGSGKSSLFNAVTGTDLARTAARRPATSRPQAAVWGPQEPTELLEWLEIDRVARLGQDAAVLEDRGRRGLWERILHPGGPKDAGTGGLVLVDLPDFDSVEAGNREVVERFSSRADVMVWVFDPQKYSDDVIHSAFVRPLSRHGGAMLAVLNQADRLTDAEQDEVLADLHSQLERDGAARHLLRGPLAVSARTGQNVEAVVEEIGRVVAGRAAVTRRLSADLDAVQEDLEALSGGGRPAGTDARLLDDLAGGLYEATRAEELVEASRASQVRAAARHTGWPPLRRLAALRRDPLKKAGITRATGADGLDRQDLPELGPSGTAAVGSAVRRFSEEAAEGVGEPWHHAIRDAARARSEEVPDALERAVSAADFRVGARSGWWTPLNLLQWLAVLTALVGLLWLTGLWAAGYFQFRLPDPPQLQGTGIPVPTGLVLIGLLLGVLLSGLASFLARTAATRHARRLRRDLLANCREAGRALVAEPVEDVVARHDLMVAELGAARR